MSDININEQHQEASLDQTTHGQFWAAGDQQSMAPSNARPKWQKRSSGAQHANSNHQRPTHFAAVQVSHEPHVIETIEKVQTSLVSHTAGLTEALVDPVTAHMTLMVLRMESAEDVEQGRQALLSLKPLLEERSFLAPIVLELQGLSHFRQQVLYLDVQQGDGCGTLKQLAATTREHFSSQGLVSDDSRPFTPHVTIAKLSNLKSYSVRKRLSRIPEDAFRDFTHVIAGPATLSELQLCAMQGRRQGSYYPVVESLPLRSAVHHSL